MKKATLDFLTRAQSDYNSAVILGKHGEFNNSCMLSQQCVEKSLKSLLDYNSMRVPKIHDIGILINHIEGTGLIIPHEIKHVADSMTSAYLLTRYTGDNLSVSHATLFINVASITLQWVTSLISVE